MNKRVQILFLLAALSTAWRLEGLSAEQARPQWREVPLVSKEATYTGVDSFALAPDGTPWASLRGTERALCYFDGRYWCPARIPGSPAALHGRLYPGRDGRLYCKAWISPRSGGSARSAILAITSNKLTRVAGHVDDSDGSGLYFDKSGRIWSWTSSSVAKFEDGKWQRWEADFGDTRRNFGPSVVETDDGDIYFISFDSRNTLVYWFRGGGFGSKVIPVVPAFMQTDYEKKQGRRYLARAYWPRAWPWPGKRAVVIGESSDRIACLNLETLEYEEPPFEAEFGSIFRPHAVFQDDRMNLWIFGWKSGVSYKLFDDCLRLVLHADTGRLNTFHELNPIRWGYYRDLVNPNSVLFTRDGSVFVGTEKQGMARIKDDHLEFFGWKDGVRQLDMRWIFEAPDRKIWCASPYTVLVWDPKVKPVPVLPEWDEFHVVNDSLLRDEDFNLWMFLEDHPGYVSRFDGRTWKHFELGVKSCERQHLLVDNLNRVYVTSTGRRSWRITASGDVRKYDNLWKLLVSAVEEGANRFRSASKFAGLVVTKDKKMFIAYRNSRDIHRYDGKHWKKIISTQDSVSHLFLWGDDSLFVRWSWLRFAKLVNGKLLDATTPRSQGGEFLIGEEGFRLFGGITYKECGDRFFPAWVRDKKLVIYDTLADLDASVAEPPYLGGMKLSREICYLHAIRLSPSGGYWAVSGSVKALYEVARGWRGLHLRFSTHETPVQDKPIRNLFEDRAGNLWLYFRLPQGSIFRVRRPKMETTITTCLKAPVKQRKVRIDFDGTEDGRRSGNVQFAWRLDAGRWSDPSPEKFAEVEIPGPGIHSFEVTAVGKYAAIDTTPARMHFRADVRNPVAKITSKIPGVLRESCLSVKLRADDVEKDGKVSYKWRVNGAGWFETDEDEIRLRDLYDGKYVLEARAVLNDKYEQEGTTKAEFEVRRVPEAKREGDTEWLLKLFYSRDLADREKAVESCVSAGKACIPALEKALKNAPPDVAWWLHAAMDQVKAACEAGRSRLK